LLTETLNKTPVGGGKQKGEMSGTPNGWAGGVGEIKPKKCKGRPPKGGDYRRVFTLSFTRPWPQKENSLP